MVSRPQLCLSLIVDTALRHSFRATPIPYHQTSNSNDLYNIIHQHLDRIGAVLYPITDSNSFNFSVDQLKPVSSRLSLLQPFTASPKP